MTPGVYTGSVYNDPDLRAMGLLGENVVNTSVIVVKNHGFLEKRRFSFALYDKARGRGGVPTTGCWPCLMC